MIIYAEHWFSVKIFLFFHSKGKHKLYKHTPIIYTACESVRTSNSNFTFTNSLDINHPWWTHDHEMVRMTLWKGGHSGPLIVKGSPSCSHSLAFCSRKQGPAWKPSSLNQQVLSLPPCMILLSMRIDILHYKQVQMGLSTRERLLLTKLSNC